MREGVDVDHAGLKDFGQFSKTSSNDIKSIQAKVAKRLGQLRWDSAAATRFRDDWERDYSKALTTISDALHDLGDNAVKMAENYKSADDAYRKG